MKPKIPAHLREEWEVKLTALLLGELPPEEAAAVEGWIAADPELAALHRRLQKALGLVKEATAEDRQAPVAPARLSNERREKLLAHFKTHSPASTLEPVPFVGKARPIWTQYVPLSLAAMFIVFVGLGLLLMNGLVQRKSAAHPNFIAEARAMGRTGSVDRFDLAGYPTPIPQSLVGSSGAPVSLAVTKPAESDYSGGGPLLSGSVVAEPPDLSPLQFSAGSYTYGAPSNSGVIPAEQLQRLKGFTTTANGNEDYVYSDGGPLIVTGSSTVNPSGSAISIGGAPATNEWQRYPGHPMTTSLGAEFENLLGDEQLYRNTPRTKEMASRNINGVQLPNTSIGGTARSQKALATSSAPVSEERSLSPSPTTASTLFGSSSAGLADASQPPTLAYTFGAPSTSGVITTTDQLQRLKPFLAAPNQSSDTASNSASASPLILPGQDHGNSGVNVGGTAEYQRYIAITGNTRTRDKVIRREIPLSPDSDKDGFANSDEIVGQLAMAVPAPGFAGSSSAAVRNAPGAALAAPAMPAEPVAAAAAPQGVAAPAANPIPEAKARSKSPETADQVKQLFAEAQGFYDTGRYDLAKKRADQILSVDSSNIAARRLEEKSAEKNEYGVSAYDETRATAIQETDRAWQRPLRRFNTVLPTDGEATDSNTQALRRKLESIVIPKLEFRDTTLTEAIDFLKKKSAELDTSSPPGKKGANIVLKLDSGNPKVAGAPVAAAPAIPGIPGLDQTSTGAIAGGATVAAPGSTPARDPKDARITVSLTNIPLIEALKYVSGLSGMKMKVEPYAVAIGPLAENTDVLITKEWNVAPDLIPRAPGAGGDAGAALAAPAFGGGGTKDKGNAAQEAAKNWLIANGVSFKGAASAIYIPRSHRLIVRNTEDQLDLVDTIMDNGQKAVLAKAEPKQDAPIEKAVEPAGIPQPETQTSANAFSTFSLNVSDVSFKLAAASLEQGKMPEPSAVRSEEFLNAFDYRDPEPAPGAPLAFVAERARDPFAQNRDLLRFAVKTAAAGRQAGRALNIVLLLDKSGSMERADRVNIVHEALRVLTAQLQPQDKLSIVTFARTPRLWADGIAGDKAAEMIARVGEITPEGGTNLEAALDLAYTTAERHFAVGSINRVVLFTDGAANLGDVNADALTKKVEAHRKQGIALDCFGIGWEDYNDDLLEQLTRNGDGRYGFLNTPGEATANFAAQLAGALQVAASDVKVQVEFNPRRVTAYRQIGYARHQLKKEEFRDNSVAAASIGAAESGNALYVVEVNPSGEGDLATVRVRFRVPGTSDYQEHEWPLPFTGTVPELQQASPALRLSATAAAFAEWLVASPYATDVTPDQLLGLINGVPAVYGADPRPKQLEWMIRQAKSCSGR